MEKTNIEYFNYYQKLFVNSIKDTFPEYKDVLTEYYSDLINNETCNDDKYVKRFMKKMKEYKSQISKKDELIFSESIFVLKNVDFKNIWENSELSANNKNQIWEYLQTMYVLGETIISDSDRVQRLVKNFQRLKNNDEDVTDDITDEDKDMIEMLKNLSQNQEKSENPLPESFFKDGMIGKLAEDLTKEINIDDLNLNMENTNSVDDVFSNLMGNGNPMKFMNLLQKVGQNIESKISSGQVNQDKLVEEAQSMMSSLQGSNPLFNNLFKQFSPDSDSNDNSSDATGIDMSMIQNIASSMGMGMGTGQQNSQTQTRGRQDQRATSTRDRLRQKLEARKNQQK